jgi:hypothetical protein
LTWCAFQPLVLLDFNTCASLSTPTRHHERAARRSSAIDCSLCEPFKWSARRAGISNIGSIAISTIYDIVKWERFWHRWPAAKWAKECILQGATRSEQRIWYTASGSHWTRSTKGDCQVRSIWHEREAGSAHTLYAMHSGSSVTIREGNCANFIRRFHWSLRAG